MAKKKLKAPPRKRTTKRAHPKPQKKTTTTTPKKDWKTVFLETLSQSPNVSAAAEAAGYDRSYVYRVREQDKEFAKAWDNALERGTDRAVGEMYRRAVYGVEKPVFGSLGGNKGSGEVGRIQEYSDTLMIFLLKAHRASIYREKVDQANLNIDWSKLSNEQLEMVANGADLRAVAALASKSGAGAETAPGIPAANP